MEKIKRSVRLFFATYGRLLLYIIGIVFIFLFLLKTLDNIVAEQRKSENEKLQQEIIKEEETKENKEYISKFIDYCNTGNVEEAYNMLSDNIKQNKYNTIEKFKSEYINTVFNIKIINYTISKQEDKYKIVLTQDMLATGKKDSKITQIYKIIESAIDIKIEIVEE